LETQLMVQSCHAASELARTLDLSVKSVTHQVCT
jgi:hypothetical protein